ncbi:MAG: hypothetical protein VXW22_02985, partial [Pseudomonadota bacterium]|nr:hypothetical protein [Pseudomonadota bacterium]
HHARRVHAHGAARDVEVAAAEVRHDVRAHGVLGLLPATESLTMMAVQSAAVHAAAMVPVVWVSHGFTAFVLSEILPKTTPPD